jgi:putative tryptophan/tyrosine transport system substrate-binding protein
MTTRRDFITLLGGAAATWPLAARAQQPHRTRLVGILTSGALRDPDTQADYAAFLQGLEQLGWSDGRNVRIERRSAMDIPERQYAAENGRARA